MRVLIAGDTWPQETTIHDMSRRLRFGSTDNPDLFIWTLDAAPTGAIRQDGRTHLCFEPSALDCLRLGKTNVAVTASNHITDCGSVGVSRAIDMLRKADILPVGAGCCEEEASKAILVPTPEGTFAILAFAEAQRRVGAIPATRTQAGVRPYDEQTCAEAITEASKQAERVFLFLHWGYEHIRYPEPRQRSAAKRFIEAGASLVVGTHTHVPMGYERFDNGTAYYGIGNFMFPDFITEDGYRYHWDCVSRTGLILDGHLDNGSWIWKVRCIKLGRKGFPGVLDEASRMLCPDLATGRYSDTVLYERDFDRIRRKERRKYAIRRLIYMTWEERMFRLRRLLGLRE